MRQVSQSTPWKCEESDVSLCLTADRNCFQIHKGIKNIKIPLLKTIRMKNYKFILTNNYLDFARENKGNNPINFMASGTYRGKT